MKQTATITLMFVLTLSVFALFWPAQDVQAQSGCTPFQAIVQASLPTSTPIGPGFQTWGGPIFALLGGEPLLGALSGNDGEEVFKQHMGAGRGGAYTICFGDIDGCRTDSSNMDTITYEVPHAVFPFGPGKIGVAYYLGNTAKIVGGTNRFLGVSGNLNVSGPAITWPDLASPFGVSGRWNVEISGKICGIQ